MLPSWSSSAGGGTKSEVDLEARDEEAPETLALPSREVPDPPAAPLSSAAIVAAVLFLVGFLAVLTSTRPSNPPLSPIKTVAS